MPHQPDCHEVLYGMQVMSWVHFDRKRSPRRAATPMGTQILNSSRADLYSRRARNANHQDLQHQMLNVLLSEHVAVQLTRCVVM